jgi:hypothetical protein
MLLEAYLSAPSPVTRERSGRGAPGFDLGLTAAEKADLVESVKSL